MADKMSQCCGKDPRESVCIDVDRVYDCCRDRDCIVDARVHVCDPYQALINNARSIKPISAELIWVYIDVEALPFNRGFYTVDIQYFFKCYFDVYVIGVPLPARISGLTSYNKRVILFGSEGSANIYSSRYVPAAGDIELLMRTNLPKATVEVVPPILLSARIVERHERCGCCEFDVASVPEAVRGAFSEPFEANCDPDKRLYATIGLFSIVRLMREVQLVVPSYDFCIPEKECCPNEDDPCCLFNKMDFPIDDFFPPKCICGEGGHCPS